MKKIYLKPTFAAMTMDESLPVATSLNINDEPQDNISGDVKGNDWNIWSDAE